MKAEAADGQPECLYEVVEGVEEGEWVAVVQSVRARLEAVRDNPGSLRAYSAERSGAVYAATLFDLGRTRQERARLLQQVGALTFDTANEELKSRAAQALADREGGQGPEAWAALARELGDLWQPRGLLDSIFTDPAAVAEAVIGRLDRQHAKPLVVWGHRFADVSRSLLEPLAEAHTVAYEREAEIHVVTSIREALNAWDADTQLEVGPESFSLVEVLVIHEVLEVVLEETTRLDPSAAHLVAATFGRCLRDTMLDLAVEAFCLDWLESAPQAREGDAGAVSGTGTDPDLSAQEAAEAERSAAERTSNQERDLLEAMFSDDPGEPEEALSASGEQQTAAPAQPGPDSSRPSPPEPVIRSTAGGGEDLSSMFDADETAPEPPSTTAKASPGNEVDGRRKRSYQFEALEGDGPRVLVVDDSSMTRHLVCEVVRKLEGQPIEAIDGIQAVALGRFHKPDVIVLDIAMPGGNGLIALRDLRASAECASTPIIMLTVESGSESIRGAIRQGATDYLIKPVNVNELSKRIAQHLGKSD